jgi:spore maturation protein CgeB
MKFVLLCHAFTSCWNNGHAHFLRGFTRELARLGHRVLVCEAEAGWSRVNAIADGGQAVLAEAEALVPAVEIRRYTAADMRTEPVLDVLLEGADVVLVQEWNEPSLVAAIGRRRRNGSFWLFYVDAHHRAVTAPDALEALEFDAYDGVLAFGAALREIYDRRGWCRRAFTWHEAADCALFRPRATEKKESDLIWVGNWGDEERSRELCEFLIKPAGQLKLRTKVYGVRYPAPAQALLQEAGIAFDGWLPNHRVPEAFGRSRVTVHIPRQAYRGPLAGIPTIRVFEALACGIPLVCSPWLDEEQLFPPGCYLQARNGHAMAAAIRNVLEDHDLAAEMTRTGREAIRKSHTCRHRAEQLLEIIASLSAESAASVRHATQKTAEAVP